MSLEPGGMGDKLGNMYEDRYFAFLMLRLVREKIKSITVEKLGPYGDYSEYIAEGLSGKERHYQCKAGNGTKPQWSVSDLQSYDVFKRIKDILLGDSNAEYCFVSSLKYKELDELCNRARRSSSYEEWIKYQINNDVIRKTYEECARAFAYDLQKPLEIEAYYKLVSRCYFVTFQFDTESSHEITEKINLIFSGEPSTILPLLEQYAKSTNSFRKKITTDDVIGYLEKQDIHLLNLGMNDTVFKRIQSLNDIYWGYYPAINGVLFYRSASTKIVEAINNRQSVILHGKAGMGKSGCLQELINYLKTNQILYLTVKLDKNIPEQSAQNFGKQLGLPGSPVRCLTSLASQKQCVLILDQLDALRWSSIHSSDAITICKEMIREAELINRLENGNISLVFASRTFDLENDVGLRGLFEKDDNIKTSWAKVDVGPFSKDELSQIIGDKINQLSDKLQGLLQTPSSLFVWTKLENGKQRNHISSVYELMDQWWCQIQSNCQKIGISDQLTAACKDRIVNSMSGRGVLSLPSSMLSDQRHVVNALISYGLLSQNIETNKLFFTHQSFLDYFLSVNMISDVYSGKDLTEILGARDDQVPAIRYRLLTVLQQLMESDIDVFLDQAEKIINTDCVRFYIQCGVFEVLGQNATPDQASIDFANQCLEDPNWHDFVLHTVFMGHPCYVEQYRLCEWISEPALDLLRSVSHLMPDFVVEKLRPYAFQSKEQDRKIYFALSHNLSDDSEEMIRFKLALVKQNPEFVLHHISFTELIEEQSIYSLDYLELILSVPELYKSTHLYLGEKDILTKFINKYYRQIAERLFPLICSASKVFPQTYENNITYANDRDWTHHKYNESSARQIVDLVSEAFSILGRNDPKECLCFLEKYDDTVSAVGHELILQGILSLSVEFADIVISWILNDFTNRIFCFSGNERDYLYAAKQLIAKFSAYCTDDVFRLLESRIVLWKEPTKRMVYHLEQRRQVNKEKKYKPVYYTYWGHLQKELLPCLAKERTSAYTKELIEVLNRNDWIHVPYFTCGFYCSDAVIVTSPVEKKKDSISDITWLRIIATPEEKLHNHWRGDTGEEASHWSFASTMGNQARKEPERFAKLSLQFPEMCPPVYISNVLSAISNSEEPQTVPHDLLEQVIKRYGNFSDMNIAIGISRIIEKYAEHKWSEGILQIIQSIACSHSHPEGNEWETNENDPDAKTVDRVRNYSYNCARGCAIHAIAALIWKDSSLGEVFKEIIVSATNDRHASVRFAVMDCVLAYYNIDPGFAIETAKALIYRDIRTVAAYGFWQIISRNYKKDSEYYKSILIQSIESEVNDLAETAAEYLCAIAVYYDESIIDFISTHNFTQEQIGSICRQAIFSFDDEQYHERSKRILTRFIASQKHAGFSHLFTDKRVKIQRDADFICELMRNNPENYMLHSFFEFFANLNSEHEMFAPILAEIGMSHREYTPGEMHVPSTELAKCINILFDKAGKKPKIRNACLDIWDSFFRNQLHDTGSYRVVSNLLNSY